MIKSKDEKLASVNLSKQDLDSLIKSITMHYIRESNKIKSHDEYVQKRHSVYDLKELRAHLISHKRRLEGSA